MGNDRAFESRSDSLGRNCLSPFFWLLCQKSSVLTVKEQGTECNRKSSKYLPPIFGAFLLHEYFLRFFHFQCDGLYLHHFLCRIAKREWCCVDCPISNVILHGLARRLNFAISSMFARYFCRHPRATICGRTSSAKMELYHQYLLASVKVACHGSFCCI